MFKHFLLTLICLWTQGEKEVFAKELEYKRYSRVKSERITHFLLLPLICHHTEVSLSARRSRSTMKGPLCGFRSSGSHVRGGGCGGGVGEDCRGKSEGIREDG